MSKWSFVVLLLAGATLLGATVLHEPIARAAEEVGATIVGPLDANGNVKVHEQGTASVTVTNSSFAVRGTVAALEGGEPQQVLLTNVLGESETYDVPIGKRFLIKYVNIERRYVRDSVDTPVVRLLVDSPGGLGYSFLGDPYKKYPTMSTTDYYLSEPVTINVNSDVSLVQASAPQYVRLSGYLVSDISRSSG
jgi:hypothetical protein